MEFKKIDENRFQCLLMEEDLEDNNITLDDFFRNDTDKIHNLLEVVMEEAARNIDGRRGYVASAGASARSFYIAYSIFWKR